MRLATAALTMAALLLLSSSARRQLSEEALDRARQRSAARRLLGLPPGASASEVRAAWKARIGQVHPDRGGLPGEAAALNAARDLLLA